MATTSIIPGNTPPSPTPPLTKSADLQSRLLAIEKDVYDWTESLYQMATDDRDRDKEVRDTFRAMDYLAGRQWLDTARRSRSRPVLNKVRRHFFENVGLLTDLAIDFQVKMWDKLKDHSEMEKLLNQLAVHWASSTDVRFEDRLYDVILYGLLHTGPSKIQWNAKLNGGMGDADLVPIAPWQWATIGASHNPQDSECIIYFPVVTKEHLIRTYGPTARRVVADMEYSASNLQGEFKRPSHIDKAQWNRMGQTLRMSLGIKSNSLADNTPFPMCQKKEFWVRDDTVNDRSTTVTVGPCDIKGNPTVNWAYRVEPGEQLYPRGRVISTAGGCVLEDQPNPYWDSRFPFPVFRPFRVPWQMSGDQMLKPWMQMNNIINKILGGMQDYLHSVIEPTLIGPKGAMPPADWDALDPGAAGGKIKYNNNAPKAPDFMKKAEFPVAAAMQYLTMIDKEYDMTSGSSAIQQALSKKQVPGSDSLDTIISSRSLPVQVESRSLASYLEDGGAMVISRMLQFYSVSHRVSILGSEGFSSNDFSPVYGQFIQQGVAPEDYVKKFSGTIRRDTLLNAQKEKKQQIAIALNKMGKLSDRMLFRILDISMVDFEQNKMELLEEARLKLLVAAAAAAASGKGQQKGKSK